MKTRNLSGLTTSAIGYGAMALVDGMYGHSDEQHGLATLRHAIDAGATLIDTADAYGAGHNEQLIARAIDGRRDEVQLATKWGIVHEPGEHAHAVPHHHAQGAASLSAATASSETRTRARTRPSSHRDEDGTPSGW